MNDKAKINIQYGVILILSILIIVLMFVETAKADSLDINLTSWHSDTNYNYNTNNFGVGFTKDIDHHWGVKTGIFKNSYNKNSGYFMGRLRHDMGTWAFGINFGIVTGYDNIEPLPEKRKERHHRRRHEKPKKVTNQSQALVIIIPTITWHVTKNHAFEVGIIPLFAKDVTSFAKDVTSFAKDVTSFATLQYQYSL